MGAFDEFSDYTAPQGTKSPVAGAFDDFDDYQAPNVGKGDPAPSNGVSPWVQKPEDFMRAMANSMTFGLADKAAGLVFHDDEKKLAQEARERSPYLSLAGDVAGAAVPGGAISKGVGLAIPALGRAGALAAAGNQAITGGVMDVANDAANGEMPTPGKVAASAALGGILGGAADKVGQFIVPKLRFAASGLGLTDADKTAATDLAARAAQQGVPLRVPEAVGAAAPGRASGVQALDNTSSGSPKGAVTLSDFNATRGQQVADATNRVADVVGDGTTRTGQVGLLGQRAADLGLANARRYVNAQARPLYRQAEPVVIPHDDLPDSSAFNRAMRQLYNEGDDLERIGSLDDVGKVLEARKTLAKDPQAQVSPPGLSVQTLDAIRHRMGDMADTATSSGARSKGMSIRQAQDDLTQVMDNAAPAYPAARQVVAEGTRDLTEPLEAGVLGKMSATTDPRAQFGALYGATTPAEGGMNAIGGYHLNDPNVQQGLLSEQLRHVAETDPLSVGSMLTTPGRTTARVLLPPGRMAPLESLLDAAAPVRTAGPNPVARSEGGSPWSEAWQNLRDTGSGRVTSMMNDPANIGLLGMQDPAAEAAKVTLTAAAEKAADNKYREITIRPKRR